MTVANGLMQSSQHDCSTARLTRPEVPGESNPAHYIYTTGRTAKICRVAARTVSKWIDAGRLKGHRLPGSLDRRVNGAHLLAFMRENGMDALIPTELLRAEIARPVAIMHECIRVDPVMYDLHGLAPFVPASEIELGAWLADPIHANALVVIGTGHGTAVALATVVQCRRVAPRATVCAAYTLQDIGEQGFLGMEVLKPQIPLIESSSPEQFCLRVASLRRNANAGVQ